MFETTLTEFRPRVEKMQLVALFALMVVGTLFVYSATMASDSASTLPFYDQTWFRQIVWYALGIGAAAALCSVDYRTIARWSLVIYCITILLLIVVLIPGIGKTHGWGARRWLD